MIQNIRIFNYLGKAFLNEGYDYATTVEVDASGWASGIYYVVVNGQWVEKVIKN